MAHIYRRLVLPVACLQPVAAYLPSLWGFPSIGARAREGGIPPELPLGPFFSIWGAIFILYILFGLESWRQSTSLAHAFSRSLSLFGVMTALWMAVSQILGHPIVDFILLLPLFYLSWSMAYHLGHYEMAPANSARPYLSGVATMLIGLGAGWISVAVTISIPRAARDLTRLGPTDAEWVVFLTVLILGLGAILGFRRFISRNIWFEVAVIWGFMGIGLNNWLRTGYGYFGWIVLAFLIWQIVSYWKGRPQQV